MRQSADYAYVHFSGLPARVMRGGMEDDLRLKEPEDLFHAVLVPDVGMGQTVVLNPGDVNEAGALREEFGFAGQEVVERVVHEPEDVRAGPDERPQGLGIPRGGTQRGDDLGAAALEALDLGVDRHGAGPRRLG